MLHAMAWGPGAGSVAAGDSQHPRQKAGAGTWDKNLAVLARKTLPGHEDALHRHWLLLLTWEGGRGGVSCK